MNDSAYKISLDIHEHASQAVIKAKKADTGRKLHITLRAGGTPYTIEDNCYAVFKAKKPDDTILFNACTIEDNEIIYEFTEQTCTSVGRCRCEIALYGPDDKIITSPRFSLLVDGTIYPDENVESTDEFSALTDLISDTLEATNAATEATENAVEAAESARISAHNAEQSSNSANQAAESATQAAQNAFTASENANEATDRANDATNAANNATINANNAANNANDTTTNLVRIVKNAMAIGQVKGVSVSMDDAVELGFVGCRIFGKTTQDGIPTPDAPVDLVSVGDNGSITVNVNDAHMTIATPNGLPGIPVASGGNYTDANGQQWICDEKDYARGVYVQRVGLLDFSNMVWYWEENYKLWRSEGFRNGTAQTPLLCETIPYQTISLVGDVTISGTYINAPNNIWVRNGSTENTPSGKAYYQMHTPIETPLSEEELAAYAALHTYRNNTTVSNDAGAYMELEYVMDAKKYIDSLIGSGTIHQATVE